MTVQPRSNAEDTMITVYGQPSCQPCRLTTRHLDKEAVLYTYVDLTKKPDQLKRLKDQGFTQTPIVETPTETFSGLDPDRLDKAVAEARATEASRITATPTIETQQELS